MAIVSLAWSEPFKEKFKQGKIRGTVLMGMHSFVPGQEVLIFVARKGSILETREAERLGRAEIKEVRIVRVEELNKREAELTGNDSVEELKNGLYKWYKAGKKTLVTFLELEIKD